MQDSASLPSHFIPDSVTSDLNQSPMLSKDANKVGYMEPNEWEEISIDVD